MSKMQHQNFCLPELSLLKQPLHIRNKIIPNRLMLAPMVGLTHIAFRQVVKRFSAPVLLSMEMCSAKSLPSERPDNSQIFRWQDGEQEQMVCQILGSEPKIMAEAARRIEDCGFWGVDINMGCSVRAICKQGGGAALLRETKKACSVVEAVRAAVSCPLSVKFRLGWEDKPLNLAEFCRDLENAGADWLIFHPRLAPDKRTRPLKNIFFAEAADAVSIPVFGNGDIVDEISANNVLQSGCAGLAIGRMAVSRPWIFSRFLGDFSCRENLFFDYATILLDLLFEFFPLNRAIRLYKQAARYIAANFLFGHQIYRLLTKGSGIADFKDNIFCLKPIPTLNSRPDIFLFTG